MNRMSGFFYFVVNKLKTRCLRRQSIIKWSSTSIQISTIPHMLTWILIAVTSGEQIGCILYNIVRIRPMCEGQFQPEHFQYSTLLPATVQDGACGTVQALYSYTVQYGAPRIMQHYVLLRCTPGSDARGNGAPARRCWPPMLWDRTRRAQASTRSAILSPRIALPAALEPGVCTNVFELNSNLICTAIT